MENNTVIRVDHVSKHFKVYFDRGGTLKERLLFSSRRKYENREVLKDISFSVRQGEAIGLIGQNGCGKSTTLKLLSRILYPDSGSITMKGRVSALIELGAGFHPDLSGRENIYTNASIFGLSRKEIDERLQTIIDFSELGEYIDNPVRTYSSGMYMRLAFSVAINVNADILLIDEILAVGDSAFQAKCFRKLQEIRASGTTIVIVSHSLGQIEQICDRTIWIDQGRIRMEGKPVEVHPAYLDYMGSKDTRLDENPKATKSAEDSVDEQEAEAEKEPEEDGKRFGDRAIEIKSITLSGEKKQNQLTFKTGERMRIDIDYVCHDKMVTSSVIGFGIFRLDGLHCYGSNTQVDRENFFHPDPSGTVTIEFEKLLLLPGEYILDIAFHKEDGLAYDYWRDCKRIRVYSDYQEAGVSRQEHKWLFT